MVLAVPLALIAAALIALIATPAATPLLGLDHGSFGGAAFAFAFVVWKLLGAARRSGPGGVARLVRGALAWSAIVFGLVGVYSYRFEAADFADRVMSELMPGELQIGNGGEVTVNERLGGEFIVPATVGTARIAFLFDTGATTVVLRAEDAAKVGIDPSTLNYNVQVTTANGAAEAAETRLDSIAIGPIVARNVTAMVTRKGALTQSLLGMSFLERLQSYSVERGRLVLKGK
jgi:aspartyl protease family protein